MRLIRTTAILCFIFSIFVSLGHSQERFKTGFNFTLGFPQGEFGQSVENTGLGGSGYFTYRLPKTPLSLGVSVGFLVYGSETREEFLDFDIPEVTVDVKTQNSILNCHFFLRAQPSEGTFRPYVDGLIGFNYLWTETSVHDQGDDIFDEIASSVNLSDFAFSYGVGGGFMVAVYQRPKGAFAILIDLGIRFLKGGEAEYLSEGDIVRENGEVTYFVSSSNTDLFTAHIGVAFSF